ncbi:porin [Burkholderia cepacia]|uniref:porin n=1 Tax=Burkholderia cepacia TaxID=292 RepID=UPI001CF5822F|nr:porin [Burkholderia cepacia]MCA8333424.1 porin [Burkholderia cepacia]
MSIKRGSCPLLLTQVVAMMLVCWSSAHAQSNVTLYGVIDSGIMYTSRTFDTGTGTTGSHQISATDGGISGSHFGITGAEDLGAGTKAIFTLESGFTTNNGALGNSNGNFFGRQAFVGLSGQFGTIKAGTQYSPFGLAIVDTDARHASFFGSQAGIYMGNFFATGIFVANAVSYTSPTIAGLQASALLALGGEPGRFQAGRQYAARMRYEWRHLVVNAALFSGNPGGTASKSTPFPSTVEFVGRTVGATYQWGAATFKGSYTSYKIAGSFNEKVYSAGGEYFFTPALSTDVGVWYMRDSNDSANHSMLTSAGLYYYLSKRTTLYGAAAFVNNHGLMHTGFTVNGALYEPAGGSTSFVVGVRHLF